MAINKYGRVLCDTCTKNKVPEEAHGMTGMCKSCYTTFCFGHLDNHGCPKRNDNA